MISFIPAFDDATCANLAAVERILADGPRLLRDEATRQALHTELLSSQGVPLFAMSHGEAGALLGHGREAALTHQSVDLVALAVRPVFAFACHTATVLGSAAADGGATWWGYTGAIQSPDDCGGRVAPEVGAIFDMLIRTFPHSRTLGERSILFDNLRALVDLAEQAVDHVAASQPDQPVSEAYLFLRNAWDRLRVWVPGSAGPERHPEAGAPILFA